MYGYVRMGRRGEAARQRIGGIWLAAATVPERGLLAPLRRRRIWRRLRKWGAVRCVLPRQLAAEAGRYGLLPVEVHRLRQAVLPQLLALQGDLRRQTAALRAAWVSPAVREAAMVLAQRARYLTLAVDSGGAALARELRERFGDCFAGCVDPIVGVQFRGCATVGGSIYGRFGFSDLCTLFLALGAEAVLYRGGAVPLETFLKTPRHGERDILLSIRIPDDGRRVAFEAFRRTATDLAVLNTAVCRSSENTWRVAVGARPAVAALALRAGELLSLGDDPAQAARTAAQELRFGDNLRGSGEYRRALCEVLTARCVEQLTSMEPNGWRRTAE